MKNLSLIDPEIAQTIEQEHKRTEYTLDLIASENYTWPAVMQATGSLLTNKYAEGYPAKRYYGGCINVDTAENLARERLKQLFGAEHANVQPHSGSQANMAVYFAVLQPGDTILGMNLAAGGHNAWISIKFFWQSFTTALIMVSIKILTCLIMMK